ncbi:hypothetical protein OYC64_003618 [Pagothenia borchgrevinki]|uniref:Uncharacterized protein n=1 Tax=Pagothenia borchgrevinki TaxID=8213 RepID=A0ABD2FQP1_PAGBO
MLHLQTILLQLQHLQTLRSFSLLQPPRLQRQQHLQENQQQLQQKSRQQHLQKNRQQLLQKHRQQHQQKNQQQLLQKLQMQHLQKNQQQHLKHLQSKLPVSEVQHERLHRRVCWKFPSLFACTSKSMSKMSPCCQDADPVMKNDFPSGFLSHHCAFFPS